jgi:membrane-associated phospholipid phosphatase
MSPNSEKDSAIPHAFVSEGPVRARVWKIWSPLWKLRNHRNGRLFPLLATFGMLVLLSPYQLTNWIASVRGETIWDPKSVFVLADGSYLDHIIPFVPWTIFVYYTIFLFYLALSFAAPKTRDGHRELLVTIQFVVLASWFAYVVFLLFPAQVDLRGQALALGATEGGLGPFYASFHWLDRPFNSWPSLHVTQTFLAAIGLTHWWARDGRKLRIMALWILWTTLALSALTTKQHFLWDVLTGFALGLTAWWFGLRPALRHLSGKSPLNEKNLASVSN